jgi:hypothetical protein
MRLLFLFILICSSAFAQEPEHSIVGADDLEGMHIYSMLQDERANIWVSTNAGLYRYNGYDFKNYALSDSHGSSLFGLVQNHKKDIFCYNTAGQIFKVESDSLTLFYTLPDTLFHNFFYIEFDAEDNLIVSGTGFFSINKHKKLSVLQSHDFLNATPITRKEDGELIFYSAKGNDLYTFNSRSLKKENTTINFQGQDFYYSMFSNQAEYLGVGRSSHIYKRKGSEFTKINHGVDLPVGCWLFVDQQDDIWILRNQRGLYIVSQDKKAAQYSDRLLFPSFTISCKLEDRDGNIWLGTFGKGIIKISNKKNITINNSSLDYYDELKSIVKDSEDNLYIGSINGNIYKYNIDYLTRIDSVPGRIDNLEFNRASKDFYFKHFVFSANKGVYDQTPFGAIKHISYSNNDLVVISAFTGVFIQDFTENGKHTNNLENLGFTDRGHFGHHLTTSRLLSAAYDVKQQTLWVGESNQLKKITKNGAEEFTLDGNSVIALDMLWVEDELYISTLKKGIVVLSNGKIKKRLTTQNGLISNTIKEMKWQKNSLYFGSNEGLQQWNLRTGRFKTYSNANGRQLKVIDFEISGNLAFVIHQRGIQTIRLEEKEHRVSPPILDFTSIIIDGKNHMYNPNLSLSYDQDQFIFNFAAKTYNNREQLVYKYQLIGNDSKWQTLPFDENSINLTGIDHGNYTLRIVAVDSNGQRSNMLSYSFSVTQPFWMAWWFYLTIVILAFTSLILFFRRRLRIQRIEADRERELNASKLTAIQSQMNPHFIFNSLNSIQDLVIQGDVENSYTYITKFANLVRKTLNYSERDFIEFDQEVQLLDLYLTLEKLRFKADFDYSIETNDIADVLVPPMLIQPFVENALVHGLLHKEGDRRLSIKFELHTHLTCTIEDNGVGRERAKEIKQRQRGSHESFAVKGIKKRLDILKSTYGSSIGFEYNDIKDGETILGTRVLVKLPVQRTL